MSAAAAPSALFRRTVRHLELVSPAYSLKNIVKVSSVVPFFGPGNSGLRKLIQNRVPRFRFNSPSLVTQFSNATEKDLEAVLKLEKGDGNSVSIPVKGLTEDQIVKLILQHDAGTA